jgi:hypothetical protein
MQCGFYPSGGTCAAPPPTPKVCGKTLQKLGKPIALDGPTIPVPLTRDPIYFVQAGYVSVYEEKDLPPSEVV